MNRLASLLQQVRHRWSGPGGLALRGLTRLVVRVVCGLIVAMLRQLGLIWARLGGRARVAVVLAALILISAQTESAAPSLSATAQGLAVLVVAGIGLWMMLTSPFRRRRW